jgi:hypothetical protein
MGGHFENLEHASQEVSFDYQQDHDDTHFYLTDRQYIYRTGFRQR